MEQAGSASPSVEHSLDDFGVPYYDFGVELSAPSRGVVVWALLREIGVAGMTARVERHNQMAAYVAQAAREHPNLELLQEPTLSICCFRYVAPHVGNLDLLNQRLHRRLIRGNQSMPSTTRVNGQLALAPLLHRRPHRAVTRPRAGRGRAAHRWRARVVVRSGS